MSGITRAELMAVVLSRALRDGDVVVLGTNAGIPTTAYRTAQLCGKPHVKAMIGSTGTVDPSAELVPESGGDQAFVPGRLVQGLGAAVGDQVRGLVDVIFLGGLQVDRRGRFNLAVVGDYEKPDLRGPGTVGLSLVASIKRTFMYFHRHDRRTFVECVDFLGGDGLGRDEGGLELVVTPLGVLGPVEDRSAIDLISVHPGVTFDEIQEHTGFLLDPSAAVVTPSPSDAELEALRSFAEGRRLGGLLLEG